MTPNFERETFVKWAMRFFATVILLGFLISFYWLVIDRGKPVDVERGEVVSYQQQVDGAWIMFVRWYGVRNRSCWGNSKRWIVAGGAILPLEDVAYPPDPEERPHGPHEWEVPIYIPQYFITSGHLSGSYSIRILYACNPLQEQMFPIVVEPPPVQFSLPAAPNTVPPRPQP